MNTLLVVIILIQSILFKLLQVNSKILQERGVSPNGLLGLQRYALIPAIFLFAASFKREYILTLLQNKATILLILGIMMFWIVGEYAGYYALNSTNSISEYNIWELIINLPLLAVIGVVVNNDLPNFNIIISFIFLLGAISLRPKQNSNYKGKKLFFKFSIVLVFFLFKIIAHDMDGALYRNLLIFLTPSALILGISIYILITSLMLNIFYYLKKPPEEEKEILAKNKGLALSIPVIWFLASLPEGFSFSKLPIYTVASISSITFLISVISDFKSQRIGHSYKTVFFILLSLGSIYFSSISFK